MRRTAVQPPRSHNWISGLLYIGLGSICNMGASAADSTLDPLVQKGKQLARIACSDCHVVASDSESPQPLYDPAPRFDEIANRPGTSERSLQRFITTTHWDGETMPMMMPRPELTKQQLVSLSRYIMSLRKR
jgi:mono/diheme cytochrome c family protein